MLNKWVFLIESSLRSFSFIVPLASLFFSEDLFGYIPGISTTSTPKCFSACLELSYTFTLIAIETSEIFGPLTLRF